MKWYFTYVLRSQKDSKLYVGWTSHLKKRINAHNEGRVPATEKRRPLELVYYEASKNKERAVEREQYFKTGFGRRYLRNRI